MVDVKRNIFLILDDRELTSEEVRSLVGTRRYSEISLKRRSLLEHLRAALPAWAQTRLVHIKDNNDVVALRNVLESCGEQSPALVIAGRAGFLQPERLTQLIERLPYAEEDFTDRLYRPLLVYLKSVHDLHSCWQQFEAEPLHLWPKAWQDCQRLESLEPLDLARIRDFLTFTGGATATRHFNEVLIDNYYYTKRSSDKQKMLAEYSFYGLAPESMRPWLIQPFEFREEGGGASYKMLRYFLADAALQWVHGAFDRDTFMAFIERLLFFIAERPRKACAREESAAVARDMFVTKVSARIEAFLAMEEGRRINALAASASPMLDVQAMLKRYLALYQRHERAFAFDYMVVGHGDPCFSNVLYDQQRYLLKLIDPKGAATEADLWTNPLYDLCKISHSVLGDYDFINNGLYRVGFTDANALKLAFSHRNHDDLKPIFSSLVGKMGMDYRIMRLGEASLFLSMLPLHIDYPNKILAFMLKAHEILREVEGEARV
ncbi:hypothetical protein [Cupriavidus necator]|uniref:Capsular polysaccharide biosynthesis protein n=1 Tax=Cupriavidus pinatubonensis (strain JMP 134 / LMG 1197) TaxID=264198 RepID=Q474S1_CUPPJ|nr:hypothetical protein [Cupriavidus necator]